jgi:hypothetical protein
MKKIFSLIALAAVVSFSAQAQKDDAPKKSVIKINPLGALFGSANLAYERALTDKSSIVIAPSFGFFKNGGYKYTTYGLGAEYRFYLSSSKSAPAGFYAGPGIGYTFGQAKFDDMFGGGTTEKTSVSGLSAKAILGHQWIWSSGFTLDLNAGIQYFNLKFKDSNFGTGDPFSGILPALGFGLGYNF